MLSNPTAPPPQPHSLHTPVAALRQQDALDPQPANKPYNTRRVSLSLTSLGIHVPGSNSNRVNARHRNGNGLENPPSKRAKHQHTPSLSSAIASKSASPPPVKSRSRSSTNTIAASARHPPIVEPTPPPSPGHAQRAKLLDLDGINDDVVVAVLEQLQSTGNRPHLIKELSNVLLNTISTVQSSSNPNAIISSRLTNYLRRPWTALAPCPLTKEQVATHPRRVYYFLTTQARQAIPESGHAPAPPTKRTATPALSLGADDSSSAEDDSLLSNDAMSLAHSARSLSPDLDLSLPDLAFTHPQSAPDMSFDRAVQAAEAASAITAQALARSGRASSPPLSTEEREFTMTASALQLRKQSEEHEKALALLQLQLQLQMGAATPDTSNGGDAMSLDGPSASPAPPSPSLGGEHVSPVATTTTDPLRHVDADAANAEAAAAAVAAEEESDERAAQRNREAADVLFGHGHRLLHTLTFSSPVLRPQQQAHRPTMTSTPRKAFAAAAAAAPPAAVGVVEADALLAGWNELQSPEDVELAELDHLLGGF